MVILPYKNEDPPWYALLGGVADSVAANVEFFLNSKKIY